MSDLKSKYPVGTVLVNNMGERLIAVESSGEPGCRPAYRDDVNTDGLLLVRPEDGRFGTGAYIPISEIEDGSYYRVADDNADA